LISFHALSSSHAREWKRQRKAAMRAKSAIKP
jgi:hypothetical protein